jgi:RNA polymerase sigma factor (sigma-70 family)
MNDEKFLPTRRTLLSRLKRWDDSEGWRQFFEQYGRLIHGAALRAGLNEAEAQDVVQETIIIVAKKLPLFHYDPALGSFKSWLLQITRHRIDKQFKKRLPVAVTRTHKDGPDTSTRTATWARLADPKGCDLEAMWDAEWEKNLWDLALARVKAQFRPAQFQMFDLYVLKEWPVKDVARALGVSSAHVYVMKHRVGARIRAELRVLKRRA